MLTSLMSTSHQKTQLDNMVGIGGEPTNGDASIFLEITDSEIVQLILDDQGQNPYKFEAQEDWFKIIQGSTDYLKVVAGDFDFQSGEITHDLMHKN